MAVVAKVKEGLFFITWNNVNVCNNTTEVTLSINEILPNHKCTLFSIHKETEYILAIEINHESQPNYSLFPTGFETLLARKDGEQEQAMTKNNFRYISRRRFVWETTWTGSLRSKCVNCSRCTTSTETKYHIVIESSSYSKELKKIQKRLDCVHNAMDLFRTNQVFTDVSFKVEDKIIKSHSTILSACSPVFSAMFQHDFQEKQKKIVVIEDIEPSVFQQLLQYIYIEDVDLKNVDVAGLFAAADKYKIDSLKEECMNYLLHNLTPENVGNSLVLAHLHQAPKLYETALDFMVTNAKAVCSRDVEWMAMIENYPELAFKVTKRITANL